jgi:alanyl-tRNA synthetase
MVERGISAVELVKVAMNPMDGRGGGRPEMAQGMGTRRDGVVAALAAIADTLRTAGK